MTENRQQSFELTQNPRAKSKSHRVATRRRKWPRRAFWTACARRTGIAISLAAGFGLPMWWFQSGGMERTWVAARESGWQQLEARSSGAGLVVGDILVEGRTRTELETIRTALGIRHGEPIVSADLVGAQARIEALPWVRSAVVTRYLPDTVFVRIEEHVPAALWQKAGTLHLIAADGAVIQRYSGTSYSHLPVVVGADAPAHTRALLEMLAIEPELARRLTAAVRIGGRRWTLHFEGPVQVMLPATDPASAWRRLADAHRRHGILGRALAAIDLRIGDRVILRPGGVVEEKKTAPASGAAPGTTDGNKVREQDT